MGKTLRPEQRAAIEKIFELFRSKKRLLFQLPTGGGKTFTFCSLANIIHEKKSDIRILFLVHRKKLMQQAANEMWTVYKKKMGIISAEHPLVRSNNFFIAMAETLFRRIQKNKNYLDRIDLVVVDEAHRGEFKKLLPLFPESKILGVTATPISSDIRTPLCDFYEDIIVGQQIKELIDLGSLTPNITIPDYGTMDKAVFANSKGKNGDYNEKVMSKEFGKNRNVQNCVDVYNKYCFAEKTIVFNCSIEHCDLVNNAFLTAGINSKTIHGKMKDSDIDAVIRWFERTDNAVLQSVDLVTTGLDVPSIKNVILNRSTTSLALYLQMCGRGSRIYNGKKLFKIIDLGGNYFEHGDWADERDWRYIFEYPKMPKESDGVAPMKECPQCFALLYTSTTICKHCGYEFPDKTIVDGKVMQLQVAINNTPFEFDINGTVAQVAENGYNRFYGIHSIKSNLLSSYANDVLKIDVMTDEAYYTLLSIYKDACNNWCKAQNQAWTAFVENYCTEVFEKEVERIYNFSPLKLSL